MHFLHNMNTTNDTNDTFSEDVAAFWDRIRENDRRAVAAIKPKEAEEQEEKQEETTVWWNYFNKANEEEAYQNYLNCKYQFVSGRCIWTLEEMMCFSKYIAEYEKVHSNKLTNM